MNPDQMCLPRMKRRKPNPPTADDLKRQGIEQALKNEHARWRRRALRVVMRVADEQLFFNADDIRHRAEVIGLGEPHHPNVWGGVIRTAILAGVMTPTGNWKKSTRPGARGRMIPLYRRVEE